jgi:hypothetical protein
VYRDAAKNELQGLCADVGRAFAVAVDTGEEMWRWAGEAGSVSPPTKGGVSD